MFIHFPFELWVYLRLSFGTNSRTQTAAVMATINAATWGALRRLPWERQPTLSALTHRSMGNTTGCPILSNEVLYLTGKHVLQLLEATVFPSNRGFLQDVSPKPIQYTLDYGKPLVVIFHGTPFRGWKNLKNHHCWYLRSLVFGMRNIDDPNMTSRFLGGWTYGATFFSMESYWIGWDYLIAAHCERVHRQVGSYFLPLPPGKLT